MFKVWPRSERRRIEDVTWIPKVTERGWVILAKDSFKLRHERREITRCGARVFSIPNGNLKSDVMADRFIANYASICAHSNAGGPCHYSVAPERLRRIELLR